MTHSLRVITLILFIGLTLPAFAADDPSIQGKTRADVQAAMNAHVTENTIGAGYVIYDSGDGKVKALTFKELHSGIVKKGDFYVSCADFTDSSGNLYDVDLLVGESDGDFRVYQALVHKVNGEERVYEVVDN